MATYTPEMLRDYLDLPESEKAKLRNDPEFGPMLRDFDDLPEPEQRKLLVPSDVEVGAREQDPDLLTRIGRRYAAIPGRMARIPGAAAGIVTGGVGWIGFSALLPIFPLAGPLLG